MTMQGKKIDFHLRNFHELDSVVNYSKVLSIGSYSASGQMKRTLKMRQQFKGISCA